MAPAITLLAPDDVVNAAVLHHYHRINPWRHRHQCRGDCRAHPARITGRKVVPIGQLLQCATHAAHHIAALHCDLARERSVNGAKQCCNALRRELERAQRGVHHRTRRIQRHVVVQRRIGVGSLERYDLRIAIAAVGGDHHSRTRIMNAVAQGFVAESAEHRRVHNAEALCPFSPIQLGRNVRHVERNAVTTLHTQRAESD